MESSVNLSAILIHFCSHDTYSASYRVSSQSVLRCQVMVIKRDRLIFSEIHYIHNRFSHLDAVDSSWCIFNFSALFAPSLCFLTLC